jgi:hypothetical protein
MQIQHKEDKGRGRYTGKDVEVIASSPCEYQYRKDRQMIPVGFPLLAAVTGAASRLTRLTPSTTRSTESSHQDDIMKVVMSSSLGNYGTSITLFLEWVPHNKPWYR